MRREFFKKAISTLTLTIVLTVMFMSIAYAVSPDYSFTMYRRVVDGRTNGVFHSITDGYGNLDGHQDFTWPTYRTITVSYELRREKSFLGNYESYGTKTATSYPDENKHVVFTWSVNTSSSKYYQLII
jgi:hypothetical protein